MVVKTQLDFSPIVPVLIRAAKEVDVSLASKPLLAALDSSPFVNVSLISLKNAPYTQFGEKGRRAGILDPTACRLRYAEGFSTSVASVVHNFVMAVVFTVATLVTWGRSETVRVNCGRLWSQTAFAVAAVWVAVIGVASPAFGSVLNVDMCKITAALSLALLQHSTMPKIVSTYQKFRPELKKAALEAVGGDKQAYRKDIKPIFKILDRGLTQDALKSKETLVGLAKELFNLPWNISITGNPEKALNQIGQAMGISV